MAERSFAITLPAVAERADVTVKTVLRHFGSRDALIDAAWSQAYDEVMAERMPPPDDPDAALHVLIAHYERRGEMVLAMLADENDPRAARMNTRGTASTPRMGRGGLRRPTPRPNRRRAARLIDVLVVATDVYAWKLLRLDRGLSVDDVHDRMLLMTDAVLANDARSRREGAMKILFAIVDGGGNIPPQLAVARALAARGVAGPGSRPSRHSRAGRSRRLRVRTIHRWKAFRSHRAAVTGCHHDGLHPSRGGPTARPVRGGGRAASRRRTRSSST